jgi:dihydroneopterin aldolase/2-amino-4-hydroxy-6-hydroxymethyldihydropteridine diphosphokinase
MDKMYIRNLQLFANHGFYKEEKTLGQLFEISLEIDLDLKTAGKTDDLAKSVNYGLVCKKTRDIFTEKNI